LICLKMIYPVPFGKDQVIYPLKESSENSIPVKKGGRGDAQLRISMSQNVTRNSLLLSALESTMLGRPSAQNVVEKNWNNSLRLFR